MPRYKGGFRQGPVAKTASAAPTPAHKRIAQTMRKTKPDGTNEVMHRVEHHFDPMPYMKKMKRYPGSKDEQASRNAHETVIHGGTAHRHGSDLPTVLRQLRDYRKRDLEQRGAFAGNGLLERPAPLDANSTWDEVPWGVAGSMETVQPLEQQARNIEEMLRRARSAGLGADPYRNYQEGSPA